MAAAPAAPMRLISCCAWLFVVVKTTRLCSVMHLLSYSFTSVLSAVRLGEGGHCLGQQAVEAMHSAPMNLLTGALWLTEVL